MTESRETNLMSAAMCCLLIVALIGMAGCATKPDKPTAEDVTRAGLMDGAVQAAKAPLFKLTCPPTGCMLGSLEIGNPGAAAQMADIVKVVLTPQPSEASQNFRTVVGVLGQVGTYGIIGNAVKGVVGKVVDGYSSGFASNVAIASHIQAPGAITTINTSSTNTLSGTGVQGSGQYTAPITTTTTTTNPSPRVCGITYSTAGVPNGFQCVGGG